MLTADELSHRRTEMPGAADLAGGVTAMERRLARLLEEAPPMPVAKAMLSVDGGICPDDATALIFDPWSPRDHRCPTCNQSWSGDRHHSAWARWQHLWLAERAGELAALAVLTDDDTARARAGDILTWYGEHYAGFPNVDNVLGPARVFFSTYLESIWLENLMAAGFLLAEAGKLDQAANDAVSTIADQAATIIGEYDERLSNRQTWNNAALLSIAVWFEDEELAHRCIEGTTGLIAHLLHGFGAEGLWYEGENYHFFALQGLLRGAGWARLAGVDIFMEPDLTEPIRRALLAARETALPDLTFPARKDARYGVALSQPMFLESCEIGLARSERVPAGAPPGLSAWLTALHRHPAGKAELFDSYLYEVGPATHEPRTRSDLSWRALLEMLPALPAEEDEHVGQSVFLESHGLALLRSDDRYLSMECGAPGAVGGHGHPDRLNLTLHSAGVHWLPDPGTGSYVASDLSYYRSTIAHNAPLVDGRSQVPGPAQCLAFDTNGAFGWIRASFAGVRRTVVAGHNHLVDVVESDAEDDHLLEIPWHFHGDIEVTSPGSWAAAPLDHPGTKDHQRFEPNEPGPVKVLVRHGESVLSVQFDGGTLWRMRGPGLPTEGKSREFLLVRASGRHVRCTALVGWHDDVELTEVSGDTIHVRVGDGLVMHRAVTEGWVFDDGGERRLTLGGLRSARAEHQPLVTRDRPMVVQATASWRSVPPDIENGLAGFGDISPLHLDHADQYRRAEHDYAGPDEFSVQAFPGWDHDGFYLAVEVHKHDVFFRAPDALPLMLDNEPDDIHCDGVQVYLQQPEDGAVFGVVAVPNPDTDGVTVRKISGEGVVHGRWRRSDTGYVVVLSLTPSWWDEVVQGDRIGFDLLVNEARPGRQRRAGQLVWSGGGGWVWLRGDRQQPDTFGTLELH